MNVLKSVENTISSLVEGAFGRMFRSEVRPMELARKLAREMDAHRRVSVSRVYAPNEYSVWLSPEDRARYEGVEEEVIGELCAYLLEHARREELILASSPHISIHTDERLTLGEFGIQAELARVLPEGEDIGAGAPPAARAGARAPAAQEPPQDGGTMIYSTSARVRRPIEEARARRPRATLTADDGRVLALPARGGTVGRSRACDVVLDDPGISRRHAEIGLGEHGWMLSDLGSTNGVSVNGARVGTGHPLVDGDRIEMGSTVLSFNLG
jgi:hypothetical protein